jgi:hypothetical protein
MKFLSMILLVVILVWSPVRSTGEGDAVRNFIFFNLDRDRISEKAPVRADTGCFLRRKNQRSRLPGT